MGIVLEHVFYKHNNSDKYFFKDLNLEIEDRTITGIVGKSGSGKTTLLELICGLNKIYKGKILIDYKNIDEVRKNIGIVFQFPEEQFFEIKVKDEIEFAVKNYHIKKSKVKEVLSVVGLKKDILNKNIKDLNSGDKRLIAILSILIYNPRIILFDEPTIGLDYKNKKKIINLIKNLRNRYDKTIIIVSHDVDLLYELCDNIIVLSSGNLILYGDYKSVFDEIEVFNKYDIPIPKEVLFSKYLKDNKNIKLLPCRNVNDLIKEVYRNV